MFRALLLLLAGAVLPAARAGEPGMKAQILGGTMPVLPAKTTVRVDLSGADSLVVQSGMTEICVKVNTLEYGQNVSRRYAAAVLISPVRLLGKSRKHFVTIGFTDGEGRQQAIVFRVDKGDIRSLLASLEARTGRRVEYTDEEARRSGK